MYLFWAVQGLCCCAGLSLAAAGGGFSLRWFPLLQSQVRGTLRLLGSRAQAQWCGARTWLLCGMGSFWARIKPVSHISRQILYH